MLSKSGPFCSSTVHTYVSALQILNSMVWYIFTSLGYQNDNCKIKLMHAIAFPLQRKLFAGPHALALIIIVRCNNYAPIMVSS